MSIGTHDRQRCYCHKDANGVTVTVAVVDVSATIPARPDKDGTLHLLVRGRNPQKTTHTFPCLPLVTPLRKALFARGPGPSTVRPSSWAIFVQILSPARLIIGSADLWTPGSRVDVDVAWVERQSSCLDCIIHNPVQHTNPACKEQDFGMIYEKELSHQALMYQRCLTYAGIVGDPDPTHSVVSNRCHLSGTTGPVLVVPVVLQAIFSMSLSSYEFLVFLKSLSSCEIRNTWGMGSWSLSLMSVEAKGS